MHKVYVFGSLNMDLVINSPREVKQGETIHGSNFMTNCGGKGANQAVAIGKLGGSVVMGGAVGDDLFGHNQIDSLTSYNVDTHKLKIYNDASTGVAIITIIDNDNRIILDGGANLKADESVVDKLLQDAVPGDIFLTQLENRIEVVGYGLKKAKELGLTTILNPAPIDEKILDYINYIDYLIPNETEFAVISKTNSVIEGAKELFSKGIKNVIVTLGSRGYCYYDGKNLINEPCVKLNVPIVDTTAAGDTFCGAFATALSLDNSVEDSLRFANKAAALTITKKGAQQSIPTLKEFNEFYK